MERPGEREGGREGEEEGGEGEKGRRGAAAVEQTRFSSSFCSALSEQKTRSPLYSLLVHSSILRTVEVGHRHGLEDGVREEATEVRDVEDGLRRRF
jgi:hypothetical protein